MKKFNPDPRNLGGRKTILDLMTKHYKSMTNIKPTINTRPTTAKQRPRTPAQNDFSEVHHAFRKAASKKSRIDNSEPHTFQMSQKLSKNKAAKAKSVHSEHLNNIKHMQRRISDIGKFSERKKNQFDPLANPVMLFRSPGSKENSSKKFKATIVKRNTSSDFNFLQKSYSRPASAKPQYQVPFVATYNSSSELLLKKKLFEVITANKIYSDKALEDLYQKTRESNAHLPQELVEKVINYIKCTLDFL